MEQDIVVVTDHIEIHPGANGGFAVVRDGSVYGTYPDMEQAQGVADGLSDEKSEPVADPRLAMSFTVESDPEVQAEYSDEFETTMTIDVMREDGETGDVWIVAGVPDYLQGTAQACGHQSGLQDVRVYGDCVDMWCPWNLRVADADGNFTTVRDAVLGAVRPVALKAHRDRMRG